MFLLLKQKKAYGMRVRYWCSEVCSADLAGASAAVGGSMELAVGGKQTWGMMDLLTKQGESKVVKACTYPLTGIGCVKRIYSDLATLARSEEHTSELQSLMRISYAVFCLKKKNNKHTQLTTTMSII